MTSWHPKCIQIVIRFLYVQLERTPKHGKENHDPLSSGVTKDQMALANHLLNLGSLENLVASLLVYFEANTEVVLFCQWKDVISTAYPCNYELKMHNSFCLLPANTTHDPVETTYQQRKPKHLTTVVTSY